MILCIYINPLLLVQHGAAVALTRNDARCNGVLWLPSTTVISAPCSNKRCTISELPDDAARCNGVEWVLSCADTSAPCLSNSLTVSIFPPDFAPSYVLSTCPLHQLAAGSRAPQWWYSPETTQDAKASCGSRLVRQYPRRARSIVEQFWHLPENTPDAKVSIRPHLSRSRPHHVRLIAAPIRPL